MILKSGQAVLKSTSSSDDELKELFQDPKILNNMTETRLYPKKTPTEMIFRIERDDKLIGELKFHSIRWFNRKAMLSVILIEEYQKKGIGTEALKTAIKFAFEKMNLHRLEAEVIEFNQPSKKLVEKLGFKLEGTLREAKYSGGKYWDIYRYGLLRKEYQEWREE